VDVVVLTVDQDGSRSGADQVPFALASLADVSARLPFERTVGDEFQGVLDEPAAVVAALEVLLRSGEWNIGIGVGPVETPLPDQARAGVPLRPRGGHPRQVQPLARACGRRG